MGKEFVTGTCLISCELGLWQLPVYKMSNSYKLSQTIDI